MTRTLLTITAPTCAGKNYLRDELERRFGFSRIVSTTTRPMRQGEVQGLDYYFIDDDTSRAMEQRREFAELIEFRGVRYGVTHGEMTHKMLRGPIPTVILEPQGLRAYEELCAKHGWRMLKTFVLTPESTRIERLIQRTLKDVSASPERAIRAHTDRLLSITGEERGWYRAASYDLVLSGVNLESSCAQVHAALDRLNTLESSTTWIEP